MKFVDLKFKSQLSILLDKRTLVKGHEKEHKELIESEIYSLNRLIDYVKSKERLASLL